MEYIQLGNSDLQVSRLCVGCMSFGNPESNFHAWTLGAEESETLVKRALDLGINFFDTANVYSAGTSEEYLGRAIRQNIARDRVILASKVYFNEGKLSKEAIVREIDGTLRRLGTDYLDLYIIHRFDSGTPVEETMEALHSLVKAGKVRSLGASAMYGYQFAEMQLAARDNGFTPFVSMQNHYNLLYREDERELIPVARQYGMSLTPYSPLASGHLTRPTWDSDSMRATTDDTMRQKYDRGRELDMPVVERVAKIAADHDVPMADVALAWHWARGVAAPIVGCSKPSRVDDAVRAVQLHLTEDEVAFLEEPYIAHELVGLIPPP